MLVVQCSVVEDCEADVGVDRSLCNNVTSKCCLADLEYYDSDVNQAVVPVLEELEARQHCR